jgi:peptidoglycan-associated lipoprotein
MNRFGMNVRENMAGRVSRGVVLAGAVLVVSGCATVKQDQFEAEMAQVRQEIRQGDEALSQRIDETERRLEARMAAMEQALGQLRDDFDVTVERLEAAVRFNAPVHFAFDDYQVRTQDREVLDRFAEVVQAHYPDATITVEGFTDPSGSAEYNRALGMRRAESVKQYLQDRGLRGDHMRAVSYGQDPARQIVPGATGPGDGGWQNRRVAMVIDFRPDASGAPRVISYGPGEGN